MISVLRQREGNGKAYFVVECQFPGRKASHSRSRRFRCDSLGFDDTDALTRALQFACGTDGSTAFRSFLCSEPDASAGHDNQRKKLRSFVCVCRNERLGVRFAVVMCRLENGLVRSISFSCEGDREVEESGIRRAVLFLRSAALDSWRKGLHLDGLCADGSDGRERALKHECALVEIEGGEKVDCACGKNRSRGLMLACERCGAWEHADCQGFRSDKQIPADYICSACRREEKEEVVIIRLQEQGEDWERAAQLLRVPAGTSRAKEKEREDDEPCCCVCGCEDNEDFEKMISPCACDNGTALAHPSCLAAAGWTGQLILSPGSTSRQNRASCQYCGSRGTGANGVLAAKGLNREEANGGMEKVVLVQSNAQAGTNKVIIRRVGKEMVARGTKRLRSALANGSAKETKAIPASEIRVANGKSEEDDGGRHMNGVGRTERKVGEKKQEVKIGRTEGKAVKAEVKREVLQKMKVEKAWDMPSAGKKLVGGEGIAGSRVKLEAKVEQKAERQGANGTHAADAPAAAVPILGSRFSDAEAASVPIKKRKLHFMEMMRSPSPPPRSPSPAQEEPFTRQGLGPDLNKPAHEAEGQEEEDEEGPRQAGAEGSEGEQGTSKSGEVGDADTHMEDVDMAEEQSPKEPSIDTDREGSEGRYKSSDGGEESSLGDREQENGEGLSRRMADGEGESARSNTEEALSQEDGEVEEEDGEAEEVSEGEVHNDPVSIEVEQEKTVVVLVAQEASEQKNGKVVGLFEVAEVAAAEYERLEQERRKSEHQDWHHEEVSERKAQKTWKEGKDAERSKATEGTEEEEAKGGWQGGYRGYLTAYQSGGLSHGRSEVCAQNLECAYEAPRGQEDYKGSTRGTDWHLAEEGEGGGQTDAGKAEGLQDQWPERNRAEGGSQAKVTRGLLNLNAPGEGEEEEEHEDAQAGSDGREAVRTGGAAKGKTGGEADRRLEEKQALVAGFHLGEIDTSPASMAREGQQSADKPISHLEQEIQQRADGMVRRESRMGDGVAQRAKGRHWDGEAGQDPCSVAPEERPHPVEGEEEVGTDDAAERAFDRETIDYVSADLGAAGIGEVKADVVDPLDNQERAVEDRTEEREPQGMGKDEDESEKEYQMDSVTEQEHEETCGGPGSEQEEGDLEGRTGEGDDKLEDNRGTAWTGLEQGDETAEHQQGDADAREDSGGQETLAGGVSRNDMTEAAVTPREPAALSGKAGSVSPTLSPGNGAGEAAEAAHQDAEVKAAAERDSAAMAQGGSLEVQEARKEEDECPSPQSDMWRGGSGMNDGHEVEASGKTAGDSEVGAVPVGSETGDFSELLHSNDATAKLEEKAEPRETGMGSAGVKEELVAEEGESRGVHGNQEEARPREGGEQGTGELLAEDGGRRAAEEDESDTEKVDYEDSDVSMEEPDGPDEAPEDEEVPAGGAERMDEHQNVPREVAGGVQSWKESEDVGSPEGEVRGAREDEAQEETENAKGEDVRVSMRREEEGGQEDKFYRREWAEGRKSWHEEDRDSKDMAQTLEGNPESLTAHTPSEEACPEGWSGMMEQEGPLQGQELVQAGESVEAEEDRDLKVHDRARDPTRTGDASGEEGRRSGETSREEGHGALGRSSSGAGNWSESAQARARSSGWDLLPDGFERAEDAMRAVQDGTLRLGRPSSRAGLAAAGGFSGPSTPRDIGEGGRLGRGGASWADGGGPADREDGWASREAMPRSRRSEDMELSPTMMSPRDGFLNAAVRGGALPRERGRPDGHPDGPRLGGAPWRTASPPRGRFVESPGFVPGIRPNAAALAAAKVESSGFFVGPDGTITRAGHVGPGPMGRIPPAFVPGGRGGRGPAMFGLGRGPGLGMGMGLGLGMMRGMGLGRGIGMGPGIGLGIGLGMGVDPGLGMGFGPGVGRGPMGDQFMGGPFGPGLGGPLMGRPGRGPAGMEELEGWPKGRRSLSPPGRAGRRFEEGARAPSPPRSRGISPYRSRAPSPHQAKGASPRRRRSRSRGARSRSRTRSRSRSPRQNGEGVDGAASKERQSRSPCGRSSRASGFHNEGGKQELSPHRRRAPMPPKLPLPPPPSRSHRSPAGSSRAEREHERERGRELEKEEGREREKEREGGRERGWDRDRDRERNLEKERERDSDRDGSWDRERDFGRERSRGREVERSFHGRPGPRRPAVNLLHGSTLTDQRDLELLRKMSKASPVRDRSSGRDSQADRGRGDEGERSRRSEEEHGRGGSRRERSPRRGGSRQKEEERASKVAEKDGRKQGERGG